MKLLAKKTFFILLAVYLFFYALDVYIGRKNRTDTDFRGVDHVFLGSSRVAASIDEEVFSTAMSEQSGRNVTTLNLGRGHTTAAYYYLIIRKIAGANGNRLDNITVFLEAPDGIPEAEKSWNFKWANEEFPEHFANALQRDNLFMFISESANTTGEKLRVLLAYVLGYDNNPVAHLRDYVRERIAALLEASHAIEIDGQVESLRNRGGIRTDAKSVERVRQLAQEHAGKIRASQRQIAGEELDGSVLKTIGDYIAARKGRLVLYRMPLSETMRLAADREIREQNRQVWKKKLGAWEIAYLDFEFACDDGNFPDLLHMDKQTARSFTRELAERYIASRVQIPAAAAAASQPEKSLRKHPMQGADASR